MATSDTASIELNQLLSQVGLGKRAALEQLYQRTSKHLFGVVSRICPQAGLAEEVLQEVYINVWRSAGSYEASRAHALTWLTSVARNKAIDALRKHKYLKQERVFQTADVAGDGQVQDDFLHQFADTRQNPAQLLEQASQTLSIQDCLNLLSVDQRSCIALTFYDGLTHEEAAIKLSKPLGTVKTWVRRGLIALKPCLDRASIQSA
jgi:RNA polymerase sigma-70 factor (ECF subfamily)